jgi:hypothetical protein
MPILGRRFFLIVALSLCGLPGPALAASAPGGGLTQEYDLKAAFLFNFSHFVEWPASSFANASAPITIGILGDDPFGSSLDEIVADETVEHRKLIVRRYHSVDQIETCHILFVNPALTSRLDQILARVGDRGVLTVGETKDFTARGGIIAFDKVKNRLRLRINLAAAKAAKLTISSMLLRQAQVVGTEAEH